MLFFLLYGRKTYSYHLNSVNSIQAMDKWINSLGQI